MKKFWINFFVTFFVILLIFISTVSICYSAIPSFKTYVNSNIFKIEEQKEDKTLKDLQEQVSELNENINSMMYVLADKESQIMLMSNELETANEEITTKTNVIDTLCGEIEIKNNTITNLENENTSLQQQIDTLEETQQELINNLQQQITTNTESINTLRNDISSINLELANIRSDIEDLKGQVNTLKSSYSVLQEEVNSLHTQIVECNNSISELASNFNVEWQSATPNTGVITGGYCDYFKLGNMVFVKIADIKFKKSISSYGTVIFSGLPKASKYRVCIATPFNNNQTFFRFGITESGTIQSHYSGVSVGTDGGFGYYSDCCYIAS